MQTKKKSTEAGNFDANLKINQFLNSFDSNLKHIRFQCLNCGLKAKMKKFTPAAFYDQSTNKMYLFRLCKECRAAFARLDTHSKAEMGVNLLEKLKRLEVKINA